ncbi:MAG TPA: cupin domain-containing protein [Steroidobacteraceae bacterium]|jgi:anti-sigma factor ChrR (cupin superfamily)
MQLNADFTQRAAVHAGTLEWRQSPVAGIERRMLERIGDEVARATSIVRYAAHSHFSRHTHAGGEEFFVLEGVFQDEHGDYPAGTYVRNPPTSAHTPGSEPGCTILVKLWQFEASDRTQVRIDTTRCAYQPDRWRAGVAVMPLHRDAHEVVTLERWQPGARVALRSPAGLELLVLDGDCSDGGEFFRYQSWLRLPPGSLVHADAGPHGCRVWIKTGHLLRAQRVPA